jgi:hypothetical protein
MCNEIKLKLIRKFGLKMPKLATKKDVVMHVWLTQKPVSQVVTVGSA